MRTRRFALDNFGHDVLPPLQPHLRDHRFARHPRGLCDLKVKGIERKEFRPRLWWGGHGREKTIRVALTNQFSAGV